MCEMLNTSGREMSFLLLRSGAFFPFVRRNECSDEERGEQWGIASRS